MAADEWVMCVDWLVSCQILPPDHKATRREANAFDLAQALRDGVLLCHLLNQLCPNSIDFKDFSPRPQMSQFLCLKNIRTFLQTCKKVFGLRDSDLFQPADLFEVRDFRKVLDTLSKLSKTEIAQRKYNGFPPDSRGGSYHGDDEDIYGNLQELAVENDIEDQDGIYDSVYQEEDDKIYDDICYNKRPPSGNFQTPTLLSTPTSKSEHCIREMIDTERNYKDALDMIVRHFITPLQSVLPLQDREIVFFKIETLLEVHKKFYDELYKAVTLKTPSITEVFVNFKTKFLVYGEFCANLPRAQEHVDKICEGEMMRLKIQECEKKANEGKFRLRDLLSVPMQRVLKYHLLLRELIKSTSKSDPQHAELEKALEAMQDLSLYVNEVKRDHETLHVIEEIQNSITDLRMPQNTSLKDYGRFQKDGELKVMSHMDNRVRSRHIFLFDKVMLMCKARGETYSFKDAIVLGEYQVEESPASTDRRGEKWTYSFLMAQKSRRLAYTFLTKSEDAKQKWIDAINLAKDNTQPKEGPTYMMHTFDRPTECDVCKKLLRGIFFQGYLCRENGKKVHKECIGKDPQPARPPKPFVNKTPDRSDSKGAKAKVVTTYLGDPRPPRHPVLKLALDEMVEILDDSDATWWKGKSDGQEGWFPRHCVRAKMARKASYLDVQPKPKSNGFDVVQSPYTSPPMPSDLTDCPWYVGVMEREAAQEQLDPCQDGTFLVRVSNNPTRKGLLSLSIKYERAVRHIKVNKSEEDKYYLVEGRYFDSVQRLIDNYMHYPLSDCFPDVKTTLKYPFKQVSGGARILGYAVAVYDYSATSTSQVSLKAGDHVAVLSKNGSDKGWWKGENLRTKKIGYFPLTYVSDEDE